MAKPVVNLYRLGRLPYVKGLNVQQVLFERLKAKRSGSDCVAEQNGHIYQANNSMILVEHEPVYTIGLRSSSYDSLYESRLLRELEKNNLQADFFRTNRGGLVTFHGPGQLVAYPILYLGDFSNTIKNRSVKAYVNNLEATIIETLERVGLDGAHTVQEYPGVWLDNGQKKIAFVGIACKRYVTMHGISINCNCDLRWFDHIVSCGIEDKAITSIHREMLSKSNTHPLINGPPPSSSLTTESSSSSWHHHCKQQLSEPSNFVDVGYVSETFCKSFSRIFDCRLLEKQHELDHQIAELIN